MAALSLCFPKASFKSSTTELRLNGDLRLGAVRSLLLLRGPQFHPLGLESSGWVSSILSDRVLSAMGSTANYAVLQRGENSDFTGLEPASLCRHPKVLTIGSLEH